MKSKILLLSFSLILTALKAQALITSFTVVDSSNTSWVARGYEDYTVSPELGWDFWVNRNYDNGVSFRITGPALTGTIVDRWFLDFAAPGNELLSAGFYPDFQRFPFQDADRPGLAFGSTGRLDNRAAGFFEILEASYSPSGEVLSFAADFTHFGETNPNNFALVELRYTAAIPEPSAALLFGVSTLICVFLRRRRRAEP